MNTNTHIFILLFSALASQVLKHICQSLNINPSLYIGGVADSLIQVHLGPPGLAPPLSNVLLLLPGDLLDVKTTSNFP